MASLAFFVTVVGSVAPTGVLRTARPRKEWNRPNDDDSSRLWQRPGHAVELDSGRAFLSFAIPGIQFQLKSAK